MDSYITPIKKIFLETVFACIIIYHLNLLW